MTLSQLLELAISVSLQVALLVAATYWLGRRVRTELTRCRLWSICYVASLLAIAAAVMLPHPRLMNPWSTLSAPTKVVVASAEYRVGTMLFVLWSIGAAASLLRLVVGACRGVAFMRTCRPLSWNALNGLTPRENGGIRGQIAVLANPRIASPFCWHFHRPYIILPEFVLDFDPAKLACILRHEIEHLHRGHAMQLFVQRVVEVVLWFHPSIWWASHQVALAREFACDDAAASSNSDIGDYLRSLLAIVERAAPQVVESPTSLAFGRDGSSIAARARRLVAIARGVSVQDRGELSARAAFIALSATVVLATALWLPVDALASPRAGWSPWPAWTAGVLHDLGIPARDYEPYDRRFVWHELLEDVGSHGIEPDTGPCR